MDDLPALADLVAIADQADTPLERLAVAERLAGQLAHLGDRLVGYYIEQARAEGLSWADIGAHVGVSRQAAQQRYTPRWSSLTLADLAQSGALSRLTERTRAALGHAERFARKEKAAAVDARHLMRGILENRQTLAVKALQALGVDLAALRSVLTSPARGVSSPTDLPIDVAARRAMEASVAEALEFGHNYVGTEHLLLALLKDPTIAEPLAAYGVTIESTRSVVRDLLRR
ncbi:Clp protease N-terminal domain-containing protein [Fodinicola acaciae]|uniref:Clp protease N-terminal domain-containing protein n=1 Tax=Fodinicola acaciae TaxID=2681555 RepID=UPI0013D1F925|nr:Clp protease N-terminal domain-containing protein [Fodinicola acaciae]